MKRYVDEKKDEKTEKSKKNKKTDKSSSKEQSVKKRLGLTESAKVLME